MDEKSERVRNWIIQYGNTVRMLREQLHMTEAELADQLGVTEEYVREIENGENAGDLPMETVFALARVFGVTPGEMMPNSL